MVLELTIEHEKPAIRRILEAALRLVARGAPEAASMREIAAEAGVSKSLLHYHFKSKDQLLFTLIERTIDAIVARVAEATRRLVAAGRPDVLEASLDAIRDELREAGDLAAILLRLAARGTAVPAVRGQLATFRARARDVVADGIHRSLAPGQAAWVPVEALAELLLALILGLGAERPFLDDTAPIDASFELLKALFAPLSRGGAA